MSGSTFHRISPGEGNCFASNCFKDGFIGVDFFEEIKFTDFFKEETQNASSSEEDFKKACVSYWDKKSKDLNINRKDSYTYDASVMYTVFCKIKKGDFVVCPDDCGNYAVGEVVGEYFHKLEWANRTEKQNKSIKNPPKRILPHRREVKWMLDKGLPGRHLKIDLRNQLGIPRTISYLGEVGGGENGRYGDYIMGILNDAHFPSAKIYTDCIAESEEFLEAHLAKNWQDIANVGNLNKFELVEKNQKDTDFLTKLNIVLDKESGRQVQTGVGKIDLFAYSKEEKQILVIELKKGRESDETVGQVLRYMGYLRQEIKKSKCDIKVKGCIITYGEVQNILCALECVEDVDYYRYEAREENLSDLKLNKV